MKQRYCNGDECWIYAGDTLEDGETAALSRGLVVACLNLKHMPLVQYVVQLDDDDFMHLEVRDIFTMTESPDKVPQVANLREPPYPKQVAKNVH